MDAFFAAVEELDNPSFRGLPVVVGADPKGGAGRGIVSTANYQAREYGIHSALPISTAWRLSQAARKQGKPPAVFVPPNFKRYGEVSAHVMATVRAHAKLVEQASIDEAYMDLSFTGSFKKARELCEVIKKEVKEKEGLTASVGLGPNKLIAKIASDFKKPDGLTVVGEKDAEAFLEPLPIRKIPGIGPKTEALFHQKGIKLVRDLKKFQESEMEEVLGKWGLDLYQKIRGRDNAEVTEEHEVKSVGEQETFERDTRDITLLFEHMKSLCAGVMARFHEEGFKTFRTIVITVRFADFETKTRSHTFPDTQLSQKALEMEAFRMLLPFLDRRENQRGKLIRLIGIRIEKLA